jgi:HopA1 effector protein family
MRSPNPVQNQPLSSASEQWLTALQDIVGNVQIQSQFLIRHPNYIPLEVPVDLVARFQQLPADRQRKYLSWRLRNFLHDIYFSGEQPANPTLESNSANLPPSLDLKNNTMRGLNLEFYEQLHSSNCSEGYFDAGWCVLRQERNGSLAVQKQGLTLHIERQRHLLPSEQSAIVGDRVAIRLPRNRLETGSYIAVGNSGLVPDDCSAVEIYFNVDAAGAIALMDSLTQQLNAMPIPFSFKVPADPAEYGHYNSGTLRVDPIHYESVRQVLQTLYQEARFSSREVTPRYFGSSVPLFTKVLAPGLGLAESPEGKFADPKDFGLNRCQLVANALLAAWDNGDDLPESRLNLIHQHFSQLGIKWQHPYLNAGSADIYTPLN